ncbi:MAG: hypothetical protein RL397_1300 [Pseudomonadota bacterium]|jgi:hypothetical protein
MMKFIARMGWLAVALLLLASILNAVLAQSALPGGSGPFVETRWGDDIAALPRVLKDPRCYPPPDVG